MGSKSKIIRLAAEMITEAEAVAAAVGATMATPTEKRTAWTPNAASHKRYMSQDFERGKVMEYPTLTADIIAMLEIAGLATPVIDRTYARLRPLFSICVLMTQGIPRHGRGCRPRLPHPND